MSVGAKAASERDAASAAGATVCETRVDHLTQDEVARRWRLSVATIERWRSDAIGPRFLKLGGQVRYRLEDVLDYERSCLRQGTARSVSHPAST